MEQVWFGLVGVGMAWVGVERVWWVCGGMGWGGAEWGGG